MKKLYLAIPYCNNPDKNFEKANLWAAFFMRKGYAVLSPISHSHSIQMQSEKSNTPLPKSHAFWMNQDLPFLKCCDEMIVICEEGWKESRGVQQEIEFAKKYNIPIIFKLV